MTLLFLLWISALSLTAVSSCGIALLVGMRLVQKRRDKAIVRSRAIILGLLIDHEIEHSRLERHVKRAARQTVLALVVLEVTSLIAGDEKTSFMSRLSAAGADQQLRRQARVGERGHRMKAIEALAAFSSATTASCLQDMWSDTDPLIRLTALGASLQTASPPPFATVARIATVSGTHHQALARQLMRRAAHVDEYEAAQALVRRDVPGWIRVSLSEALSGSADFRAVLALKAAANDSDAEVRASAIDALAAGGAPEGFATVMEAVDDRAWIVRVRAVSAIGKLGLAHARGSIVMRTEDPNWWVRLRAAEALRALDAAAFHEALAC